MTDHQAYYANLPRKRISAGALFLDEVGNVLLVNPTYKPRWEIPGGIVEENESPREACNREVGEELGILKPVERLLSVNYWRGDGERPEGLQFVFWGGVLTMAEIANICLPKTELSEYRFVSEEEAAQLLSARVAERMRKSLAIVDTARTVYLEM